MLFSLMVTFIFSSDRPERDSADDSALLFGRTSCRFRSKNISVILHSTGAQSLLSKQGPLLLLEHLLLPVLLFEQEHATTKYFVL